MNSQLFWSNKLKFITDFVVLCCLDNKLTVCKLIAGKYFSLHPRQGVWSQRKIDNSIRYSNVNSKLKDGKHSWYYSQFSFCQNYSQTWSDSDLIPVQNKLTEQFSFINSEYDQQNFYKFQFRNTTNIKT